MKPHKPFMLAWLVGQFLTAGSADAREQDERPKTMDIYGFIMMDAPTTLTS
ncbi:MAG TPA: hypothetical protein VK658_02365 [Chryseolinea sp.]|nr:hypothetical protein [Chryseolinea sp.]